MPVACTDLGGLIGSDDGGSDGAEGGSSGDASADAAGDGAAPQGDGGTEVSRGVHCGAMDCAAGLHCCYDSTPTCQAKCPNTSTEYVCDEPGDCDAGQLCCAGLIGSLVAGSTCGGPCSTRLCTSDTDCSRPTTCKPLGAPFPPGIYTCR